MAQMQAERVRSLWKSGLSSFKAGLYKAAVVSFSDALQIESKKTSQRARLLLSRSYSWLALREAERCIEDCDKFLEIEEDAAAYLSRGKAQLQLRAFEASSTSFRKGLALKPDSKPLQDGLEVAMRGIRHGWRQFSTRKEVHGSVDTGCLTPRPCMKAAPHLIELSILKTMKNIGGTLEIDDILSEEEAIVQKHYACVSFRKETERSHILSILLDQKSGLMALFVYYSRIPSHFSLEKAETPPATSPDTRMSFQQFWRCLVDGGMVTKRIGRAAVKGIWSKAVACLATTPLSSPRASTASSAFLDAEQHVLFPKFVEAILRVSVCRYRPLCTVGNASGEMDSEEYCCLSDRLQFALRRHVASHPNATITPIPWLSTVDTDTTGEVPGKRPVWCTSVKAVLERLADPLREAFNVFSSGTEEISVSEFLSMLKNTDQLDEEILTLNDAARVAVFASFYIGDERDRLDFKDFTTALVYVCLRKCPDECISLPQKVYSFLHGQFLPAIKQCQ